MRTVTTTYQPVSFHATQNGTCPVCGKAVRRSRKFEVTVNPFNRKEDGTPRTVAECREQVKEEALAWVPDFTHTKCKDN